MRKITIVATVAVMLALIGVALLCYRPSPVIRFIKYRQGEGDRQIAVFRVTNHSNESFEYHVESAGNPLVSLRVLTAQGWQEPPEGCGLCTDRKTIAPHASFEFDFCPPPEGAFMAGVRFYRGSVEKERAEEASQTARLGKNVRYYFSGMDSKEGYTWSDLVQLSKNGGAVAETAIGGKLERERKPSLKRNNVQQ